MPSKSYDALPPHLPPRGLSRAVAAAYIGVSTHKFDDMVADSRMPRAKIIDARRVWDRWEQKPCLAVVARGVVCKSEDVERVVGSGR